MLCISFVPPALYAKVKNRIFFSFMNPVGEYLLSGCCVALFSILLAVEYFKLNNLKLKDAITLIR